MNIVNRTFSRDDSNGGQFYSSSLRKVGAASVVAALWLAGSLVQVYAACTPTKVAVGTQNVIVGAQAINQPLGVGARIGTFVGSYKYLTVFNGCGIDGEGSTWGRSTKSTVSTWNGYGVYPTGVEGIGYAIELADGTSNTFSKLTTNETGAGQKFYRGTFQGGTGVRSTVYFVTTAPLKSGVYAIPSQNIAITRSRDINANSIEGTPSATSNIVLNAFTLTVKNQTCDLAAGDTHRTVALPIMRPDAFPTAANVVAGTKDFEITANCTDASNVSFKFTGTPAPDAAWRFANAGTARNISLTLYSRIGGKQSTITSNNDDNTRTVPVSGGKAVLPLGAGYFKSSKGQAATGTLISNVTVNITYN